MGIVRSEDIKKSNNLTSKIKEYIESNAVFKEGDIVSFYGESVVIYNINIFSNFLFELFPDYDDHLEYHVVKVTEYNSMHKLENFYLSSSLKISQSELFKENPNIK